MLRVSAKTNPKKLGAAICGAIKENGASKENGGSVVLQAVGPTAVNQMVKGIAVARGMAAPEGADIKAVPGFADVEIDGQQVTAIQVQLFWR